MLLLADVLLPGGGSPAMTDAFVRVLDGRIAAMGPASGLVRVSGEPELPLPGCTVMAGLVDAHDHLHGERRDPEPADAAAGSLDLAVVAATEAERHLRRGITTVRVLGAPHGIDAAVRRAIGSGVIRGPDVQLAGRALTWPGGPGGPGTIAVRSVDEAIDAVEAQAAAGADVIKVMASGGIASGGGDPSDPGMAAEILGAASAAARTAGLRVAAHAIGRPAIRRALEAGVDTIEHGIGLDAELARRMAAAGVVLVPTLTTYRRLIELGPTWGLPDAWVARARSMVAIHDRSVRDALEAGVTVATGSDGFGDVLAEVEALVGLGLDGTAALDAATANGAAACGLAADRGVLRPGMRADLLVVRGDPRTTPGALRSVCAVLSAGELAPALLPSPPLGPASVRMTTG